MIVVIILSFAILAAYVAYAIKVCGSLWSLSDSYYQLKKRARPYWLFQVCMIVPALLLLPAWLECSPESLQFLAFFACGGLMFVGSAPLFKEDLEQKVHYGGTIVAGLSTLLWTCLSGMWWLPAVTIVTAVVLMVKYKRWLFWIEMAAFACAYVGVILKTI